MRSTSFRRNSVKSTLKDVFVWNFRGEFIPFRVVELWMKFHTFRILEIRGQSSRNCVFSLLPLFYFFFLPRGKLEAPRAKTTGIRQSDDDIIIRPTPRTVGAGLQTEIVGRWLPAILWFMPEPWACYCPPSSRIVTGVKAAVDGRPPGADFDTFHIAPCLCSVKTCRSLLESWPTAGIPAEIALLSATTRPKCISRCDL